MRQGGQIVAVAQVARSQYFVEQTVTRLLLVVLGMGAAGLVVSAAVLAGRTLRPIAAALQRRATSPPTPRTRSAPRSR
ncbi:MAG: hypothetical protein U0531_04470 [Dehalococcoidia bacterium]